MFHGLPLIVPWVSPATLLWWGFAHLLKVIPSSTCLTPPSKGWASHVIHCAAILAFTLGLKHFSLSLAQTSTVSSCFTQLKLFFFSCTHARIAFWAFALWLFLPTFRLVHQWYQWFFSIVCSSNFLSCDYVITDVIYQLFIKASVFLSILTFINFDSQLAQPHLSTLILFSTNLAVLQW